MKNLMVLPVVFIVGLMFVSGCASPPSRPVAESHEHAPCVMVEVKFIEITQEDLYDYSFDWTPPKFQRDKSD